MIHAPRAGVPEEFLGALEALASHAPRAGIELREIEAPRRISPYAVAFEATVRAPGGSDETELATGRIVVLYDPTGQDAWNGRFRVVTLTRAMLDVDMAADPLFDDVAWSWLEEAVEETDAHTLGGTVTRVLSTSFGVLSTADEDVDVEIRASWTPGTADLAPHLQAWYDLMLSAAGIPPQPDGVTTLRPRHGTMDP
ncbi:DUF3000 domain-containing protein [Paraoerskovia marina]|uniref:DUF3000 domain-containing protein n=1 Tax=Paraoerskovia marina TaxID=545619 RepID=A0A1H1SHP3_9CELL|nr:DUF3000 domain-containing protein [Paraoerskovia marina]SDS46869.1 Protein of unknown function [Paraoerskovia marina]